MRERRNLKKNVTPENKLDGMTKQVINDATIELSGEEFQGIKAMDSLQQTSTQEPILKGHLGILEPENEKPHSAEETESIKRDMEKKILIRDNQMREHRNLKKNDTPENKLDGMTKQVISDARIELPGEEFQGIKAMGNLQQTGTQVPILEATNDDKSTRTTSNVSGGTSRTESDAIMSAAGSDETLQKKSGVKQDDSSTRTAVESDEAQRDPPNHVFKNQLYYNKIGQIMSLFTRADDGHWDQWDSQVSRKDYIGMIALPHLFPLESIREIHIELNMLNGGGGAIKPPDGHTFYTTLLRKHGYYIQKNFTLNRELVRSGIEDCFLDMEYIVNSEEIPLRSPWPPEMKGGSQNQISADSMTEQTNESSNEQVSHNSKAKHKTESSNQWNFHFSTNTKDGSHIISKVYNEGESTITEHESTTDISARSQQ